LDRGFGRPTQHVAGDADAAPIAYSFEWAPAQSQPNAMPAIDAESTTADEDAGVRLLWNTC
jgi:hypothetical protein